MVDHRMGRGLGSYVLKISKLDSRKRINPKGLSRPLSGSRRHLGLTRVFHSLSVPLKVSLETLIFSSVRLVPNVAPSLNSGPKTRLVGKAVGEGLSKASRRRCSQSEVAKASKEVESSLMRLRDLNRRPALWMI